MEVDDLSFEAGLAELEAVVEKLETGELALEDALKSFERGVGLVRRLHSLLSTAEQKVEVLTRDADGKLRLDPVPPPKGDV